MTNSSSISQFLMLHTRQKYVVCHNKLVISKLDCMPKVNVTALGEIHKLYHTKYVNIYEK
jgi:hypothetical protein